MEEGEEGNISVYLKLQTVSLKKSLGTQALCVAGQPSLTLYLIEKGLNVFDVIVARGLAV